MNAVLTKYFPFSASREAGGRIHGHNFILGVTVEVPPSDELESRLVDAIHSNLLQKLESRDLGLDVEFLRGKSLADAGLLGSFWPIIERSVAPQRLLSLSLERDKRTRTTMTP